MDETRNNASESDSQEMTPYQQAAMKVRTFPQSPGVYLMKNASGVVIYVGKATNLRSRAGSYFLKAAAEDSRTAPWIGEITDVDYLDCESEVDALLVESRLIKDIQPQHNKIQKDDKSFPYLQISTYEDFPRVEITREPASSGVSYMVLSRVPVPFAGRFRCCSEYLNFAPVRLILTLVMNAGVGSGLACWRVSSNARRLAT